MTGSGELLLLAGALAAGCALGTVTGLVPGVHVNTIAPLVLGLALGAGPELVLPAALLLLGVATVHTILNVIPTLAAPLPDDDTALQLLPLQRLAQAGHGTLALVVSVRASWLGGLLAALFVTAVLFAFPSGPAKVPQRLALYAILSVVAMLVFRHSRPFRSLWTLLLAGAAGMLLLDLTLVGPLGGDGTILLPAFAGLFGVPMLLLTLIEELRPTRAATTPDHEADGDVHATPQDETDVAAHASAAFDPTKPPSRITAWLGTGCGLLVALFPGLTSATAGAVGRAIRQPHDDLEDVAMLSAVDTANVVGNTGALVVWGATRSGASAAVLTILPAAGDSGAGALAAWILGGTIAALAVGSLIALALGPGLVARLRAVPAVPMALAALLLLVLIVVVHGGAWALVVTACLVPLGMLPHRWQTPRALLMGFLLVPYLMATLGSA